MSASKVIRWAGLSAVVAGVLFIVGQIIHPPHDPSSVDAGSWAIAHYLYLGMGVFGMLGLTGIYARQVEESGSLGFVGFIMLYFGLAVFAGIALFEASIMPLLTTEAPQFISEFFTAGTALGALGTVTLLAGLLLFLGPLLFGIATIRAGIFPRWAAILLIIGAALVVLIILLPEVEVVGKISGAATGLGLAWLGYAVWSSGREKASEPSPAMQS